MKVTLRSRFPEITDRMRDKISAIVRKSTEQIATNAHDSMAQSKHGVVYKRNGRSHHASAPGESPAIDTGRLSRSLKERYPDPFTGEVVSDEEYASILEYGGKNMAARPFLGPARDGERPFFYRDIANCIMNENT